MPEKVDAVEVRAPKLAMAPPSQYSAATLSALAPWTVTPARLAYTPLSTVSTDSSQAEVWQPVALPSLPSRVRLVIPGAGWIVAGSDEEVPEVESVQLPT